MNILTCPVCGEKLNIDGKAFKCANSHSFDIAKQGYVNLLLTNKSGDKKGDSRAVRGIMMNIRANFMALI